MKYYSIHEFSKLIGRTPQTLRNWDNSGKLKPNHTGANGYRYYSHEQLREVLQMKDDTKGKLVIGYCRVSSNKQKDDLQRQIDNMKFYLDNLDKPYEIISDIGSGINYSKKGLRELIKRITAGQAEKIVVLYKDRLLHFGYELVEYIAHLYGCEIEVIDNTEKTEEQELVEDLIQILTVFSCRLQGKRANKARKMIQEFVEESEATTNDTSQKS